MGIYIQQSLNGRNADKWMGVLVINGKKKRINLLQVKGGEGSQLWERTKKQAQAKFEQWRLSLVGGQKTRKEALKIAEDLTKVSLSKVNVDELHLFIPDGIRDYSIKTYMNAISALKRLMNINDFGVMGGDEVEQFILRMKNDNMKGTTINCYINRLACLWSRVYQEDGNPFRGRVLKVKSETESRTPLTEEQVEKLLSYAKENDTGWYNVIVCALSTALRKYDVCHLRWKDIDLTNDVIPSFRTHKTGSIVNIPIFPKFKEVLVSLKNNGSEYVFPHFAEMYESNPNRVSNQLKMLITLALGFNGNRETRFLECSKKCEVGKNRISKYDFHCLRTTAITQWVRQGLPINVVATITGHKELNTLQKFYNKTSAVDFRSVLQNALPSSLK